MNKQTIEQSREIIEQIKQVMSAMGIQSFSDSALDEMFGAVIERNSPYLIQMVLYQLLEEELISFEQFKGRAQMGILEFMRQHEQAKMVGCIVNLYPESPKAKSGREVISSDKHAETNMA